MVVPENLPSQLRALDSPQQLYAPLFFASYCSSTPHLFPSKFSEKLKKLPPFPHNVVSFFPLPQSSHFPSFLSISDLPSQRSLLQPPFLPPFSVLPPCSYLFCHLFGRHLYLSHSFCSRLTACRTPLQKVPPRVKVLLQLQKARLIPYGH